MAVIEHNGTWSYVDSNKNVHVMYPKTKKENVEGLEDYDSDMASLSEKCDKAVTVAKGKNRARVFATTDAMNTWLADSANAGVCQVGDNLYIVDVGVPDWWISEVLTTADSSTGFYYTIAQLETQKVDLTSIEAAITELQGRTLSDFGVTASATELNYMKGVTSNVQTQINNLKTNATAGKWTKTLVGSNSSESENAANGRSYNIAAGSHDFLFISAKVANSYCYITVPLAIVTTLGTIYEYYGYSNTGMDVTITSSKITFAKSENRSDQTSELKVYYLDRV